MSIIHGASHQAIKHFRKTPAAMAIYWCYLARTNYENVAWPSLRGLEHDTGWNKDTCAKARHWLVEHQALELVTGYIRPEWREMDKNEQRQRMSLDNSEYYRPTGRLVIDGITHRMLYTPDQDALPEETPPVVPPRRTPTPSDADQIGQNLVPSLELDSKKDSAQKKRTAKPAKKDTRPVKEFNALKDAIVMAFGWKVEDIVPGVWGKINKAAAELYDVNVTPEEVPALHAYCKKVHSSFGPNALPGAVANVRKVERVAYNPPAFDTSDADDDYEPDTSWANLTGVKNG